MFCCGRGVLEVYTQHKATHRTHRIYTRHSQLCLMEAPLMASLVSNYRLFFAKIPNTVDTE